MVARQSIVPAVQLGSGVAPWLIIAGVWFNVLGLAWIGLIAFGAAVLFTFLTLPVEIGASGRALTFVAPTASVPSQAPVFQVVSPQDQSPAVVYFSHVGG